jgi:hypothetical protein
MSIVVFYDVTPWNVAESCTVLEKTAAFISRVDETPGSFHTWGNFPSDHTALRWTETELVRKTLDWTESEQDSEAVCAAECESFWNQSVRKCTVVVKLGLPSSDGPQIYWRPRLCPSSGILNTIKQRLGNGYVSIFVWGRDTPAL